MDTALVVGFVGCLDLCEEPRFLAGWAASADLDTSKKLTVAMVVGGTTIGTTIANIPREDLRELGGGHIAFDLRTNADFCGWDLVTGHAKLVVQRDGMAIGQLPLGLQCRRALAAEQLRQSLRSLEAATRLLTEDELVQLLDSGDSVVPPEQSARLTPFVRSLYDTDPAPFSDLLNRDPDGTLTRAARPLVGQFESLGANCEFGLVQRHFGAEPPGLLRWGASIGALPGTIAALRQRLDGAGENVSLRVVAGEYNSFDERYQLIFHTDRLVGKDDPALLLRNERKRIPFLARSLMQELEAGERIFIFKFVFDEHPEQITELFRVMNEIGDAPLLWVTLAERPIQIGTVERLQHNLFKGYIDRFSPPGNIYEYCSYFVWLRILRETVRLRGLQ